MQATTLALDHLLRAVGDPADDLRGIGPGHPEFHRAQIIRAGAGVLAKTPDSLPALAEVIRTTDGPSASLKMRAHLRAAEAWLSGNPVLAAETYARILSQWPDDLLALRLAQSCFFFLGWHDRLCALVDSVLPAWDKNRLEFGFVLAMASFAHAENGDFEYAEVLGRRALVGNPTCPIGVHAVAHAIAESGRRVEGAAWMRDQRAHWDGDSRMRTHNAFHLAMFDVEDGNIAPALNILDTWLLPGSERSTLEASDAVDLLWCVAAQGVDVASRWRRVSDAFARTVTPGYWPYVDLHAGLAHFAAGRPVRAEQLARVIEEGARGSDYAAERMRQTTLPGLRALRAWADGRYVEAAASFAALRPRLDSAGGSRVQLEVFRHIERDAISRQRVRQPEPLVAMEYAIPQVAVSFTNSTPQIADGAVRPLTVPVAGALKLENLLGDGQSLVTAEAKTANASLKAA